MLRIEEIVGAMDDEFRYALNALSDQELAELTESRAKLRRKRPVGVSQGEALSMIATIQSIRAHRRNQAEKKPSPPRKPRPRKAKPSVLVQHAVPPAEVPAVEVPPVEVAPVEVAPIQIEDVAIEPVIPAEIVVQPATPMPPEPVAPPIPEAVPMPVLVASPDISALPAAKPGLPFAWMLGIIVLVLSVLGVALA